MTRTATVTRALGWRADAACTDADPEQFFPQDGETPARRARREKQAKAICDACPVRALCLASAVRQGEKQGIWGGLNETELSRYARSVRRAARRNAAQENAA